jgi:hypothetical protein
MSAKMRPSFKRHAAHVGAIAVLGLTACRHEATAKGTRVAAWALVPRADLRLKGDERDGKTLDIRLNLIGTKGEVHLEVKRKSVAVETDGFTAGEKPIGGRAPSTIQIDVVDGSPWQVVAHCDPARFSAGNVTSPNGTPPQGWRVRCDVIAKLGGAEMSPSLEFMGDDRIDVSSVPNEQVTIDGAIVPSSTRAFRLN